MKGKIAVLDDESRMAGVLAMVLRRAGHDVTTFDHPGRALAAIEGDEGWDLLLTDLRMPGMDGLEVLRRARARRPLLLVVLLTAHGTVKTAVAAMREGAFDYLEKPVDNDALCVVVEKALAHAALAREHRALRATVRGSAALDPNTTRSPAMKGVLDLTLRAARSRSTVLITGESGTGKEVIARAIHTHSERVEGPFVAINCKALSAGVLESELFGHQRGAFTGAERDRPGVFERAHGGTVFLDEVGEIDLDFQAKLLRVLQEGEVQRVGGDGPRRVDVRVVAATNKDLRQELVAGRFREDLYFRLAVIPIALPPLRERREDILPLASAFLDRQRREQRRDLRGWSPEVERWMLQWGWPGNVRELENTIERGVVLARGEVIEVADLLLPPRGAAPDLPADATLEQHLDHAAAEHIRRALAACGGVKTEAAARLGIDRTTLYRWMKRFGMEE